MITNEKMKDIELKFKAIKSAESRITNGQVSMDFSDLTKHAKKVYQLTLAVPDLIVEIRELHERLTYEERKNRRYEKALLKISDHETGVILEAENWQEQCEECAEIQNIAIIALEK